MKNKLVKAIILDDEESNLTLLELLIQKFCPNIEVTAKCQSIAKACSELMDFEEGILFLDINLGEKETGLSLAKALIDKPVEVIVVTAHSEFAIEGYQLNVTDYLLKPVIIDDLIRAVDRAVRNIEIKTNILDKPVGKYFQNSITLNLYNRKIVVEQDQIEYLKACKQTTEVHILDGTIYEANMRIGELELLLKSEIFIRIHKSYIINRIYVHSLEYPNDGMDIIMNSKISLPVSRRKKRVVKAIF